MKITLITLALLCSIVTVAQDIVYEPRILILSPGNVSYDPFFQTEINELDSIFHQQAYPLSDLDTTREQNIQLIGKSAMQFSQSADAFGGIPQAIHQDLCFKLFRGFQQLLVLIDTTSSDLSLEQLRALADERNMQHIILFPEIRLYRERKTGYASLTVKMYDRTTDSFVLDETYTENWNPEKGEPTVYCDDETVACLFNKLLNNPKYDLTNAIATYNPLISRLRLEAEKEQLEEEEQWANAVVYIDSFKRAKFDLLKNDYFERPFDRSFLQKVIPASDHSIRLTANYQLLFNSDSTKFVAFFLDSIRHDDERLSMNDARVLYDNFALDHNLEIDIEIMEEGGEDKFTKLIDEEFSKTPNMRGYLVRGVIYYGEWYYDKLELSDYAVTDLQKTRQIFFTSLYHWNFFRKESTDLNPGFWLSENEKGDTLSSEWYLFARVVDHDHNANYKYSGKRCWNRHKPANESYIGLYEVVANQIVRETKQFDPLISETILFPAYQRMIQTNPTAFNQFGRENQVPYLLYPHARNMILNPVVVTNAAGEKHLRYFVVVPETKDVFEWTYFAPTVPKDSFWFKDTVKEQLKTLTDPGKGIFFSINDTHFWEEYVFKKSGDQYLYLVPVGN